MFYNYKQILFAMVIVFSITIISCKQVKKIEDTAVMEVDSNVTPFFKLSLAQWSLHREIKTGKLDPFDFPKTAKELGFNAVEWVDQLYAKDIEELGLDAVVKRWKEESEKHGIKNVLIMVDRAGDLADPDEGKRNASVEMHKKYIDAASYLGCHAIRVNTFGTNDPEEWVLTVKDGLEKLIAYAATKNISVLAENHGWFSSDPRLLIPVINKIDSPYCGILADFGNWCIDRKNGERWGKCLEEYPDKYEGFERLMTKAQAVSAKAYEFDADGNETTLDFKRMLKTVKDSGYKGYVSVEYESETLDERKGILATKALLVKVAKELNN